MKLGLVVHACNLPLEAARIRRSFEALGAETEDVEFCLITEADYQDDPTKFNPAAAKNIGIRRLLAAGCDGIVCIDADYILPPGLFYTLREEVLQPFHVWVTRRDCTAHEARTRDWRRYLTFPIFSDCRGSCNYMSAENWRKVGGWDERTFGFGGDDDILHYRCWKAEIEKRRIDALPLMHVRHDLRPWSGVNARGKENWEWHEVEQPNYLTEEAGT